MKIGAIGIRTKIIVGDAATWYLVKKYLDNAVIKGAITPEERAKLAGLENYTHPATHPASILDVVDVVDGSADKFLNERGEMVEVSHETVTGKNSEAAFQHVDITAELGEHIDETAHSLVLWNGAKALKVLFSRVVTFFESYFLKFGGQNFGVKKTIGSVDNQDFAIKTNNVERVEVSAGGRVTIKDTLDIKRSTANYLVRFINDSNSKLVGMISHEVSGGIGINGGMSTPYSSFVGVGIGDEIRISTNSTQRIVVKKTGEVGIGTSQPKSKFQIVGAVQIADDTAAASTDKEGAIRYRKDANNSYIEMCMQTGAAAYSWVIIKQNTW